MGAEPQFPDIRARALGASIRALRARLGGENQTDFGKRYGVNQVTVSHWETGAHRPDPEHMKLLRADGLELQEEDRGEWVQMDLPFERTFVVHLRIGPQRADSVHVKLRLEELAN